MARIYDKDENQQCLTWLRNAAGTYDVSNDEYDKKGKYIPGSYTEYNNQTMETIERTLINSKESGYTVKRF